MHIKKFNFPTFEEWNDKRIFQTSIGDFNLHIKAFSWGDDYTNYVFGIACRQNPLDIYSSTIFHKRHEYHKNNPNKHLELKNWYEQTTREANEVFENYMIKTYCENEG